MPERPMPERLNTGNPTVSLLFSPIKLRELTIKNRVWVSPMCMYSAEDGVPNEWHSVHLGSRAVGGAGLVLAEATGVSPEGRITPGDTGLWNDEQAEAFSPIARLISKMGAVPGIQIAHAGRKASTDAPWRGGRALGPHEGGWQPVAPSPIPFDEASPTPRELTVPELDQLVENFVAAARRAAQAGFQVVEIHAAHGYLLHEFLSPLSNHRTDEYGGSLENRTRLLRRVVEAVRAEHPAQWPLLVRISATDWVEGGWDLEQSIELCRWLKDLGTDLIDCSSGGNVAKAAIPGDPDYQVRLAEAIRREVGIPTGAVGRITRPKQGERIVAEGRADAILLARQLLHDPYWPIHAAEKLGAKVEWPAQYGWGVATLPKDEEAKHPALD